MADWLQPAAELGTGALRCYRTVISGSFVTVQPNAALWHALFRQPADLRGGFKQLLSHDKPEPTNPCQNGVAAWAQSR